MRNLIEYQKIGETHCIIIAIQEGVNPWPGNCLYDRGNRNYGACRMLPPRAKSKGMVPWHDCLEHGLAKMSIQEFTGDSSNKPTLGRGYEKKP